MNNENSRNWNLFLLLFGRTVSDVGSSIQMLVMPLYILDIGGTAGTIGLFSFLSLIPILIVFPLGGVLGDRFNRKGIMVTADFLSGTSLLALTTISYMGKINIPILLIVQVMVGMFYGFFEPASKGMIPQLVDSKDLNKANSKVATLRVFSGLVAPLIAVVLYTQYGITLLFLINAISFVLSGVSEIFIKFTHFPPKNIEEKKWIVNDLYQGFKFIKSSVTIRKLSFFFFIIFTFIQPLFAVVLPVFYRTQLSYKDTQYGLIQMALFLGAMVGSILVGKLIDDKNLKGWLINGVSSIVVAFMVYGILLSPFALDFLGNDSNRYLAIFMITMFFLALSMMFISIPVQTMIQRKTPNEYMSRVFSIVGLISKAGVPIGGLVYGLLIDNIPIHLAVTISVFIVALISINFIIKFRKVKEE